MAKELNELKCRDCLKCNPAGWWQQMFCGRTGVPIDPDGPACVSIERKPVTK